MNNLYKIHISFEQQQIIRHIMDAIEGGLTTLCVQNDLPVTAQCKKDDIDSTITRLIITFHRLSQTLKDAGVI